MTCPLCGTPGMTRLSWLPAWWCAGHDAGPPACGLVWEDDRLPLLLPPAVWEPVVVAGMTLEREVTK